MLSDARVKLALEAMRPRIAGFRAAVSGTLGRTKSLQAAEAGPVSAGATLGSFANGRIDLEKFAKISAGSAPLDVVSYAVLDRAVETLESVLAAGDTLFMVSVPDGHSVAAAIDAQLTRIGSAFSAATMVDLVRRRSYDPIAHGLPFGDHRFVKWTPVERRLAPPLFVRCAGADLDPFQLGRFLDGSLQLILLIDGECAPAPLARLISPEVFVAQTEDAEVISRLANHDGPGIVAIMSGHEARFTHDPAGGVAAFQRVRVIHVPDSPARKHLGARTGWQQREDVAVLRSFVELPSSSLKSTGSAIDPAERLTQWLIEQSSLTAAS